MDTTCGSLKPAAGICELALLDVKAEPFPHAVHERFVDAEHYRQLCRTFPVCPPGTSPTGFSLYWGDEAYQRLLDEQPVWRAPFDTFHRQTFIEGGREQVAEGWGREGFKVGVSRARHGPHP